MTDPAGGEPVEAAGTAGGAAPGSVGPADSGAAGSVTPPDAAAEGVRPAPDPWKGFRGVLAATLILESIVVLLTLLVVTKIGDNGGALGVGVVLALAVAMIVATRYLGRSWGPWLGAALQIVMIACGFLVGALGALGVVFALVYGGLLALRRDVAAKMARGELPSQRQ
ncbi:MAG TPA: DUF4233 domain-containing protein [Pseudonocardia sp.]|nr:DUF4233 domain-containing protein [Pseudonocardia sp.]